MILLHFTSFYCTHVTTISPQTGSYILLSARRQPSPKSHQHIIPSLFLSFLSLLLSCPTSFSFPKHLVMGSWKRCQLPQRDLGSSPGRKRICQVKKIHPPSLIFLTFSRKHPASICRWSGRSCPKMSESSEVATQPVASHSYTHSCNAQYRRPVDE